jgi:hypothetical protein
MLPLINLSMPARPEQDVSVPMPGDHAGLASPVMMLYLGAASALDSGPRRSRSRASALADTGEGDWGVRRVGIVGPTSAATSPSIGMEVLIRPFAKAAIHGVGTRTAIEDVSALSSRQPYPGRRTANFLICPKE